MPTKFLVVEIRNDAELGKIVEALTSCTERLAVVDDVPGVFDQYKLEDTNKSVIRKGRVSNPSKKRRCLPSGDVSASDFSDQIAPLLNGEDFPEGLKENIRMALDASILEEYGDAIDSMEDGVVRTLRRRGQREEGESPLSVRRKVTETTLICGLCHSKMTLRASYGRTRLREHVMRHLNMSTAQCGHCDFKGVLREHVRRHYLLKHKEIPATIVELEPTEEYNNRFDNLWKVCFPTVTQIQPRMTSQRAKAHEAQYYSNYENLIKGDSEDAQQPTLNETKVEEDQCIDYTPLNSTMIANSLEGVNMPEEHLNGSGRSDELFFEPRESFTNLG